MHHCLAFKVLTNNLRTLRNPLSYELGGIPGTKFFNRIVGRAAKVQDAMLSSFLSDKSRDVSPGDRNEPLRWKDIIDIDAEEI